jgi:DNA-binding NarL/FixJ family response regulator
VINMTSLDVALPGIDRARKRPETTLHVLICDETRLIRDGLQSLLAAETDIEVVGTTDSGLHAMMLVRDRQPQVVVTGLALRSISGVELIRRILKEQDKPPRVVVFAADEDEVLLNDVLAAGATGLLNRDASREELTSAVRAAGRGQPTLGPNITQMLLDWFREHGTRARPDHQPLLNGLTQREREVLLLVASGRSTEELAEELCIGPTTVRTHIYRLRHKLRVRDRAQLVSFAYQAGLVLTLGPRRITAQPIKQRRARPRALPQGKDLAEYHVVVTDRFLTGYRAVQGGIDVVAQHRPAIARTVLPVHHLEAVWPGRAEVLCDRPRPFMQQVYGKGAPGEDRGQCRTGGPEADQHRRGLQCHAA